MTSFEPLRLWQKRIVFTLLLVLSLLPGTPIIGQESDQDNLVSSRIYLPLVGVPGQNGQVDLEQAALRLVATRAGLPVEELSTTHSTYTEFSLSQQDAHLFKIHDQSGNIHSIGLSPTGNEVDIDALVAAEEAAYAASFGRLHPTLAAALSAGGDKPLPVMVWLNTPLYESPDRPPPQPAVTTASYEEDGASVLADQANAALAHSGQPSDVGSTDTDLPTVRDGDPDEVNPSPAVEALLNADAIVEQARLDRYLATVDAQWAEFVAEVTTPVVDRINGLGVAATADGYAPVVYTTLTAREIQEIAQWDEVAEIYLDQVSERQLEIARQTIYAHTVNSRGITGSGIRVAQIEVGGRINTSNPYLSGVVQDTTYSCLHAHAAAVAGDIRSTHPTRRGIAPAVTLWAGGSCSGDESQLQNRSTAAINWGARTLNLSLGADRGRLLTSFDRYYDSVVINQYRSVVVAAGNIGAAGCPQGTSGNVMSPATAYNVIAVGNFNDRNTTGWSDDLMNACSSWRNPTSASSDREKPEVAAPGTAINSTTNASPWTGDTGSGTSYSAPMVTAATALLIQRNASLSSWPEAVKAIIMATAMHNIEGSARLSQYDGAGAVILSYADDVARGVRGNWGAQSYNCSTNAALVVSTVSLSAGRRFRATIAWDNDPNYSAYNSRPGADLDLQILNAAGTVVASSASYDNTYEVVDFTPSASGNYRIRVNRFRCNYSPRWLGWAWAQP